MLELTFEHKHKRENNNRADNKNYRETPVNRKQNDKYTNKLNKEERDVRHNINNRACYYEHIACNTVHHLTGVVRSNLGVVFAYHSVKQTLFYADFHLCVHVK